MINFFSLRFFDNKGMIREHFICFEELLETYAENYFKVLRN